MNFTDFLLKNNVLLAPMAGVTDLSFRLICRKFNAGLAYSEMVSAKGLFYNSKNTHDLLASTPDDRPIAVQIFGREPTVLAKMAYQLQNLPIDIIDINMGCPTPKIVKNGEGSALMAEPKLVGQIVKEIASAVSLPVTVKIRKGINGLDNAVEIAKIVEENGAAAITVHPRTREEYYSGNADWSVITDVRNKVSIPVIGNGDITSPQLAKKMLQDTGCHAIMIGRAAQGYPWIFNEIHHYLKHNEILEPPSLPERKQLALLHCDMIIKQKGEYIGVREMRKHLSWYTKGFPNAAKMRSLINKVVSISDVINIFDSF